VTDVWPELPEDLNASTAVAPGPAPTDAEVAAPADAPEPSQSPGVAIAAWISLNRPGWTRLMDPLIDAAELAGALLGTLALAVLALRAALRIETRWDAFAYHIPIAAKRAELGVPFEMSPYIRHLYEGLPPLPEFLQGLLWRATGSLNATGVVNMLALLVFLYFCHRQLKAPFRVVAILSLTVPLVIIHAASNYVDLFGSCLLAIGSRR
jgi:hypothetical protein